MKKRIIWLVVSCLVVLALLVTSCAKAEEKAPAPAVKETAPAIKEAAPAVKEAAPAAGAEMVRVTLTKKDGTTMEKLVEKPKYGGTLIYTSCYGVLAWDETIQSPWRLGPNLEHTNEMLLMGNWYLGPGGTEEMTWLYASWFTMDNATGDLAESWELADPGTLVFHIRKGVKWALDPNSAASRLVNGREFTADDVVFNLKRIYIDVKTSTMYGMAGVSRLTDVYATDKYTVVVKAPAATIADTLDNVSNWTRMVPPEVVKKYGDMNQWENVVGTGPFILTDYVPMSSITYVRNPNYWMKDPVLGKDYPLPYVDGLKFLLIPDMSSRMAAVRTGKVDHDYYRYPLEQFQQLTKYNPDLQYVRTEPALVVVPAGRVDKPELPFDDIRVRRALMLGINNQEIVDTYFKGDSNVLVYKMPPLPELIAMGWHTELKDLPPETRELYEYHPDKAKQLLAEAGYPNGFKTEITVDAADPLAMDLVSIYKSYWAKIGVELTLDPKETGVHQSIYMRKAFKEMHWQGRGGVYTGMYLCRKGNMYNWAMLDDPKIDDYYYPEVQKAFLADKLKLNKLMREMNQYVLSKAWYYPPPTPRVYFVWQPWLKGYHGEDGPVGLYRATQWMRYAWLDQDLKKSMGY